MARLHSVDPALATGKTKELLDRVLQNRGRIPNMVRLMANSPAALGGYLNFAAALAGSALSAEVRASISILVAADGESDYTLAVTCAIARKTGLSEADIMAAKQARAKDPKTAAALRFSESLLEKRGHVSSSEVDRLMEAGFSDGEVAEIVAVVALNIYRNYFNLVAAPEIDFPPSGAGAKLATSKAERV
jgi:alkylhydroperoxidase family enzyme